MNEEENNKIISAEEDANSDNAEKNNEVSGVPDELDSLEKVAYGNNGKIMAISSIQRFGQMPNPIIEKLTEGHIDKLLDNSSKSETQSRRYGFFYFVVSLAFIVFLTVFLVPADRELFQKVLELFLAFLGGLGSGFVVKSYLDRGS